jgi:hypothetical protein
MLQRTDNVTVFAFKLIAAAYSVFGIQSRVPTIQLGDYFVPSFASYIPFVFRQGLTDEDVGKKFLLKAVELGAILSIDRVIQPKMREALANGDTSDPVMNEMAKNDCWDWEPRTKIMLAYIPNDEIVPAENTRKAESVMRRTGHVHAAQIPGKNLDHVSAAAPALRMAVKFFDGGFAAIQDEISDSP